MYESKLKQTIYLDQNPKWLTLGMAWSFYNYSAHIIKLSCDPIDLAHHHLQQLMGVYSGQK